MARRIVRTPYLACALIALSGCQGLSNYTSRISSDFGQCFRGRVAAAAGLYVEAEITTHLQPAVGFADVALMPRYSLEWDPSRTAAGELRTAAFPTLLVGWPWFGYQETADGYGETRPYLRGVIAPLILMNNRHVARRSGSLLALHHWIPNPRLVDPELSELNTPPPPRRPSDDYWVGASATLLLARFDFAVNPLEFWDLVFGIIGFDLLDDDVGSDRAPSSETPNTEAPNTEAPNADGTGAAAAAVPELAAEQADDETP
ncbi:MAG: hypothetical protein AAF581_03330 [Planctomycetota bacterium]